MDRLPLHYITIPIFILQYLFLLLLFVFACVFFFLYPCPLLCLFLSPNTVEALWPPILEPGSAQRFLLLKGGFSLPQSHKCLLSMGSPWPRESFSSMPFQAEEAGLRGPGVCLGSVLLA